jgi:glycosyltransferase involved in cell wall biosynthesis
MKVAILFKGDYNDQKGYFNSVRNRIKHLSQIADFTIGIYMIQVYEPFIVRLLRGTKKQKKITSFYLDDLKYNNLWVPFSLIDYILKVKINFKELFSPIFYKRFSSNFSDYDLILAHSLECGIVASNAHKSNKIPYFVTWHGCDINNEPFINNYTKAQTVKILKEAAKNYFVSKALLEVSDRLIKTDSKVVLYNGVSDEFTVYPVHKKNSLRLKYNVDGKKVVAFIGGLVIEKNVLVLPQIFKNISSVNDVTFWIIGDGKYRKELETECKSSNLDVRFFGNQPPSEIPDLLNCIDVLILTSLREGLPLVVVEALACGCRVFASRVGGIAEAIGIQNTFDLNNDFENKISKAIIESLTKVSGNNQTLDTTKFSWKASAQIELFEINKLLKVNH